MKADGLIAVAGGVSYRGERVCFAGSRYLEPMNAKNVIHDEILALSESTLLVVGGSGLVDITAERFAKDEGLYVVVFYAGWKAHGRAAGPMRNKLMADYADRLVAFWDMESRGTKSCIEQFRSQGKPVTTLDMRPKRAA